MASLPIPATNLTTQLKPFCLLPTKPISPIPQKRSLSLSLSKRVRHRSFKPYAAAEALETTGVVAEVGAEPEVAAEMDVAAETEVADLQAEEKELRVVVKGSEKPRLVLRFIWMEKNIGLALDQMIPGHGTIPLSPYYWWPRKDAWEELKAKLEEKPWISQKRMIILLNQATDIINLWQQSGAASL